MQEYKDEEEKEIIDEVEIMDGFSDESYNLPEGDQIIVDTAKGEILDKSELDLWDIIKNTAISKNVKINDPKPNCKKCYGRGYVATDAKTHMPLPCLCIYTKEDKAKIKDINFKQNRSDRRKSQKRMRTMFTKMRLGKNPTKSVKIDKTKHLTEEQETIINNILKKEGIISKEDLATIRKFKTKEYTKEEKLVIAKIKHKKSIAKKSRKFNRAK